jgi:hypothetical protein
LFPARLLCCHAPSWLQCCCNTHLGAPRNWELYAASLSPYVQIPILVDVTKAIFAITPFF